MGGGLKTHEGKHSIGIFFPTFYHVLVLMTSPIQIHGEESIGKVRLFLGGLMQLGLSLWGIWSVTYRGCSQCEGDEMVILELSHLDAAPEHYSPRLETLKGMSRILKGRRVQGNHLLRDSSIIG